MKKYCYVCKTHVALTGDQPEKEFHASGHSDEKIARSQRNLGRKRRPAEWQR